MSALTEAQFTFATMLGHLLVFCSENTHHVTMGECFRTPEQQSLYIAQGRSWTRHSRHLYRLAVDLNLFLPDGTLAQAVSDYAPLGAFWRSLDPACVWGGEWAATGKADPGHFEYAPAALSAMWT